MHNNPRRLAREVCLQALYQCDTLSDWSSERGEVYMKTIVPEYLDIEGALEFDGAFAAEMFKGVLDARARIDDAIRNASKNWPLEKMTPIDRNILRLSTYELLFQPETSVGICISEALEIAKTFSTDEATKFINGVLDKIAAQRAAA